MRKVFMLLLLLNKILGVYSQTNYNSYPIYNGKDLGLTYTPAHSTFRIWAPTAEKAELLLYENGYEGQAKEIKSMAKSKSGTWTLILTGDQKNRWYAFRVMIGGKWMNEVTDPYTRVTGINGKRGLITSMRLTDPARWTNDRSPVFRQKTDAIIYELHIRDASIAANSGIKQKGKFLGLAEQGTVNPDGLSTGLDHIKELGVTHIHLLPFFDFNSIDESKPGIAQYNWGYDPLNYNVPEGSFASNAADGVTRVKELKQLIQTLHTNGLRVVMDVVYNHTGLTDNSNFNQLVPGYYYRHKADGSYSNATACGNETASERPMMRKFILESMKYWVEEFHVDGFRVDLMGVHDIATMNLVSAELHKIRPDILLYGEGWTAGSSPLPDSLRALKQNAYKLDRIAVFSDDIRDGIKGHVFTHNEKGFASGKPGVEESVKFGIAASVKHPQVNYSKVNYSKAPYSDQPFKTITYTECHDNHALWDKLAISATDATRDERVNMHKLALSIVLTSQGISFLHAGTEFLRTKKGVENSFESPDSINAIDWSLKTTNKEVFDYVKFLVQTRKQHQAFRMGEAKQVATNIRFLEGMPDGLIAYTINGAAVKDSWKKILVILNGKKGQKPVILPPGNWKVAVAGNQAEHSSRILSGTITPHDYSCYILYQ